MTLFTNLSNKSFLCFQELKSCALSLKKEGNDLYASDQSEEAVLKYTEAMDKCPLCFEGERAIFAANRAAARVRLVRTGATAFFMALLPPFFPTCIYFPSAVSLYFYFYFFYICIMSLFPFRTKRVSIFQLKFRFSCFNCKVLPQVIEQSLFLFNAVQFPSSANFICLLFSLICFRASWTMPLRTVTWR